MKLKSIVIVGLAIAASASLTGKSQAAYNPIYKWCYQICNQLCIQWPDIPTVPEKPDVPDAPETPETPDVPETPEIPDEPQIENNASAYELKVLELVNAERAKAGLSALAWDNALANVARAHSRDMANRGFFAHNNPDGKTPFDRIKAAGISYRSAGENIAAGQRTPEEVVEGWMNSEGHRANILNASFTKLGVGYVEGKGAYKTYWTQNFIG